MTGKWKDSELLSAGWSNVVTLHFIMLWGS